MTGAAGGIGSAIVQRFLNDGARCAIFDLNEKRGNELLADEFKAFAAENKVGFYKVNVSKRQACFDAVDQVVTDFGRVDFLVNGVAYFTSSVSLETFYGNNG